MFVYSLILSRTGDPSKPTFPQNASELLSLSVTPPLFSAAPILVDFGILVLAGLTVHLLTWLIVRRSRRRETE